MNRNAYPRPNFRRTNWENLNGKWEFTFDKNYNISTVKFDSNINVPFVYQSELSGINTTDDHDVVWYRRSFDYIKEEEVILHFGAVDYETMVYLNGKFVGKHIGGSLPFKFNITELIEEKNELVVRVFDPSTDESIPRGKQYWKEKSEAIWYTKSTGIWQTVWLENINTNSLDKIKYTPNIDKSSIRFELDFIGEAEYVEVEISKDGEPLLTDKYKIFENKVDREVNLLDSHIFRQNYHNSGWLWTPENPHLFDMKINVIKNNEITDTVESYFGMRKVNFKNGKFYLNNNLYYLRLVLDQGYFPKSLLTAPDDEAFEKDIELSKALGFNGCRKHQKVEEPNFLYECDRLGYIVWGEIPAATIYNDNVITRMREEFMGMIDRDYNHPSIIAWVCLNESWAVPKIQSDKSQQSFSQALYYLTKAKDQTRLVISNDGWSQTKTDVCAIHNYSHGQKNEPNKYVKFKKELNKIDDIVGAITHKGIYADGFEHDPETPVILTEFGGIAFNSSNFESGWGYTQTTTEEEFLEDLARVMDAVYSSESLCGFCYTQITDVEQEVNGLLNYDRTEKIEIEKIRKLICNVNNQ